MRRWIRLQSSTTGGEHGQIFRPPNQRLQLALPPFGARPLAVLRSRLIMDGEIALTCFVRMTPALQRGAAETLIR